MPAMIESLIRPQSLYAQTSPWCNQRAPQSPRYTTDKGNTVFIFTCIALADAHAFSLSPLSAFTALHLESCRTESHTQIQKSPERKYIDTIHQQEHGMTHHHITRWTTRSLPTVPVPVSHSCPASNSQRVSSAKRCAANYFSVESNSDFATEACSAAIEQSIDEANPWLNEQPKDAFISRQRAS